MKTKILLTSALLLGILFAGTAAKAAPASAAREAITVYTTPGNLALAEKWQSASQSGQSVLSLDIKAAEASDLSGLMQNGKAMALLSENELSSENHSSGWKMVIGRNILVPVISDQVAASEQALSPRELKSYLSGEAAQSPYQFYFVDTKSNRAALSIFIGQKIDATRLIALPNTEAVVDKVQHNSKALGFCSLTDISGEGNRWISGIQPLAFDISRNGQLEKVENIYQTPASLSRGAWIGKYPKGLVQSVYLMAAQQPLSEEQQNFARWALTRGQSVVEAAGITALVQSEVPGKLSKIEPLISLPEAPGTRTPISPYLVVLGGLIVLALIVFEIMVRRTRTPKDLLTVPNGSAKNAFTEAGVNVPGGMLFDRGHTWAFREKDGTIRIGLDDFIQKLTGPLSRVIMEDEETLITKGEPMFTLVQDGKQLVIVAPVSGTIKALNANLISDASAINRSPYDEGWVYMVEPLNWNRESTFLRVADNYREWLTKEFARLKDFFEKAGSKLEPAVVMQDGGELAEHALGHMGPEVWEDFQVNFLDQSN